MFDASVGSELFVTLGLVFPLHFIKRIARERTRMVKLPITLGATEALKVLVLNPYHLAHCRIIDLVVYKSEQHLEAATF